jgi:hypothetical protein
MDNRITIDEALAPFSKWLAKSAFNEKYNRTLSQKVEDEVGISKNLFHLGLGIVGIGLFATLMSSRN